MARARPIPGLAADTEFAAAAARVVAVRAAEVAEQSHDVLDVSDIERVHDMRVATRRLRAALEVFEACFPKKQHRAALREVKTLADALGERRDRDVTIALFEGLATAMPSPDRAGVASLVGQLRAEQAAANEDLAPFVTDERLAELSDRLAELVGNGTGDMGAAPTDGADGGSPAQPGGDAYAGGNGA